MVPGRKAGGRYRSVLLGEEAASKAAHRVQILALLLIADVARMRKAAVL